MGPFTDLGIDPHVGTLTPHVGRWARIVNLEDGSVELDITDASQPLPNSWSGEGWGSLLHPDCGWSLPVPTSTCINPDNMEP